jgi:DNA-repair protein XRCC3
MKEGNDESVLALVDSKLNLQCYKRDLVEKGVLNINTLFGTPLFALAHQTGVPYDVIEQILSVVANTIVSDPMPYQFSQPRPRFMDAILDRLLVVPESGILEISGIAGSGKSNIIYQLAVNERIEDMSRSVILISTEGKVPTERLHQIAECRSPQFTATEIMDGILIHVAESVDQLRDLVQDVLPQLFFGPGAAAPSLVIIDSIAALFRLEFDSKTAPEKTRLLFDIANTLKWISASTNTLIVVTNQATANMAAFMVNSNEWVPSLGLSWANCVNVRVRVTKTQMKHEVGVFEQRRGPNEVREGPRLVPIRSLYVEISPVRQDIKGQFYIDNSGVHGL